MKWHNGPNGPGRCRAKQGNCPFGGEDSHFNSLQEAEQAYKPVNEQEFDMLPGIKRLTIGKLKYRHIIHMEYLWLALIL